MKALKDPILLALAAATLAYAAFADQYYLFSGTDPSYTQTNIDLATYRTKLKNRSANDGPPPYAHCP